MTNSCAPKELMQKNRIRWIEKYQQVLKHEIIWAWQIALFAINGNYEEKFHQGLPALTATVEAVIITGELCGQ